MQLLDTNPPTLTQQITTQGIINPDAWAKIQEKVNTLVENNELIDRKQKTLGRSHEKLKKLTKTIHQSPHQTSSSTGQSKNYKKKQDDRKKKVKFATPIVSPGNKAQDKGKQVNVVKQEEFLTSESKFDETSETNVPDDTSVSPDDSDKAAYFDLYSSSSDENDSDKVSDDEE